MPAPRFVHLRIHSEYSIVDSTLRIDEMVALAAADQQGALALTDLNNLFGFIKFYKAARAQGIKPICGVDLALETATGQEFSQQPAARVLLLAQHRDGYRRLCEWITRAYRDNHKRGQALFRPEWLSDSSCTEGVFALSGGWFGEVGLALRQGQFATAERAARFWAERFPGRYALEIHRTGFENEERINELTVALAAKLDLPVVATHPVQFARPEDFQAHEARVCIAEGYTLGDSRRPQLFTEQQAFRTQDEMLARFSDLPEVLANTVAIAQSCNLELTLGKSFLPDFPLPEGVTIAEHLEREVFAGLERRLARLYPDPEERIQARPRYEERCRFEIDTIVKMGFPGYFLIVADFIGWAKRQGIPVGPGRGSGAGSLVAYALGITDLDPLRYDLLFERFLNPERVSMPDFDIDFCQDGRDRVIEYVRERYGRDSVSQIATFGTLAAKAAVRDCGRVLDMPYGFVDGVAKLIPMLPGRTATLARMPENEREREANTIYVLDAEPLLLERSEKEEDVAALLELAHQLEGLPRNVGMHAGGVLIAPGKLTDFCPLYAQEAGAPLISQFDKDDVEAVGLVKFDFLGLTTLTIIDWTIRFIQRLDPSFSIDLDNLPLDDAETYRIFREGNTVAIFQFESPNMRDMLIKARPSRLEDLIALNALYRPGPMDLIPDYIARKNGQQAFSYPDPRLEPILAETYGIMVYQEQVMQTAQVIGGYSLGGADLLRRAMGKKKPEEMAKHRSIFRQGAAANGLSEAKADELFDLMEKFAGYGFNKSHSAAYAWLAYQTAYFKRHHTAAFMAANMSAVLHDTDKLRPLIEDARSNGLSFEPPDINLGEYRFVPVDRTTIRYGLGGIKGTGEGAINEILRARKAGPFADLFDFCRRVNLQIVNRRTLEALIRAGAFDRLHPNRASVLASVALAVTAAEQAHTAAGQNSLFADEHTPAPPLIEARPWTILERLAQEKAALGLYLSGHPYMAYAEVLGALASTSLARVGLNEGTVRLAGIIHDVRVINSRNGRIAYLALDDRSEVKEILLRDKLFEEHRHWLKEDIPVVLEAQVKPRFNGDMQITALALYDFERACLKFAKRLCFRLNGSSGEREVLNLLGKLKSYQPKMHEQGLPVAIRVERKGTGSLSSYVGELQLGPAWRLRPQHELIEAYGGKIEFQ